MNHRPPPIMTGTRGLIASAMPALPRPKRTCAITVRPAVILTRAPASRASSTCMPGAPSTWAPRFANGWTRKPRTQCGPCRKAMQPVFAGGDMGTRSPHRTIMSSFLWRPHVSAPPRSDGGFGISNGAFDGSRKGCGCRNAPRMTTRWTRWRRKASPTQFSRRIRCMDTTAAGCRCVGGVPRVGRSPSCPMTVRSLATWPSVGYYVTLPR